MTAKQRTVELNEPSAQKDRPAELRQHLLSASNQLYLYELLCIQLGQDPPTAIKRAHATVRAELKRLEARLQESP
jgi:hypothetical protein